MASVPPQSQSPTEPIIMEGSSIDDVLSSSSHLTHEELMARRSRRVKQLAKIYRTHYWAFMEEVKSKYKEYYWKYGKSPFKEDDEKRKIEDKDTSFTNGNGQLNNGKLGFQEDDDDDGVIRKCSVSGCKGIPMALTKYCHPHILLDSRQKLYKGCTFVVKSGPPRHLICGKPTLRSTIPALCPTHFQKAEIYVARALRKAGLNVSSPSKAAPKFHLIVKELVHQIQSKRRAAQKENVAKVQMNGNKTC